MNVGQQGVLQEIVASLAGRGRRLLAAGQSGPSTDDELVDLCDALLSSRGEASGGTLAQRILSIYRSRSIDGRVRFFDLLLTRFGIHPAEAVAAAQRYAATRDPEAMQQLQASVEPRRQELLRRLNLAASGTSVLVRMRADLLGALSIHPNLREVDMDFGHLFQSWFNRGFLEVRRIDWNTPAAVLDKIIHYEAVHQISDWDDLRRRIDPQDRRLYAFFHPALPAEPLIFLEVALTLDVPSSIQEILDADRDAVAAELARTAVFYSISNTQAGLRGISFGSFLIKQVLEDLRREFRNLKTFVTLSPLPGFTQWLRETKTHQELDEETRAALSEVIRSDWPERAPSRQHIGPVLIKLAAEYVATAKNAAGVPLDPVARFHLGNGARLERVNWPGDLGQPGVANAAGVMVNYLYRPDEIERNHEAFTNAGTIAVSQEVGKLIKSRRGGRAQ